MDGNGPTARILPPMMRKSQDRIFVLRSDRLGDIVLSSGYLASLAEQFPDHEIELWLSPEMTACSEILHPKLTVRALLLIDISDQARSRFVIGSIRSTRPGMLSASCLSSRLAIRRC